MHVLMHVYASHTLHIHIRTPATQTSEAQQIRQNSTTEPFTIAKTELIALTISVFMLCQVEYSANYTRLHISAFEVRAS